MKKRTFLGILCALLASAALAAGPYDEQANAETDVQAALVKAHETHKGVILVFGANWCPDCRELDKALHGDTRELIDGRFVVTKIDVGNFDKNLDISRRYGNPIEKGIPAVVILDSAGHLVYASRGGELADARKMGDKGIYEFFSRKTRAGQ